MSRPALRSLALATAFAPLLGCGGRTTGPASLGTPPIVLISIDTLRADRLPAYGYTKVETPQIDKLRADSVLFENAYTHVPLTLPAHASLFTGRLPPEHQVRDNLGYRLDGQKHQTLAALLKARGYETGGAVSAYVLRGTSGISAGFDFYEDSLEASPGLDAAGAVQRPGGQTLDLLLPWLGRVQSRPFFLFFHIYEPHSPFAPPEPYKSRYADAYDGEVAASDAIVGRLLDELQKRGLYERALIVLLSDHGEGLNDHGEEFHGILLYREVLQVPLLVKLPAGERRGERVQAPVELIDVLPTVAAFVGAKPPEGLRGQALLDPRREARPVYAETFYPRVHLGWSELRSLIDARWHYIEAPRSELYDVVADPRETRDAHSEQGGQARSMRKALSLFPAGLSAPSEVAPEELEKLRALGYLGGGSGELEGPLPNPRDRIHVLEQVKTAFRLSAERRDAQAVDALGAILKTDPQLFDVLFELGRVLQRLGRNDEAYAAFRRAMRVSPAMAPTLAVPLARVCLELQRWSEAETNAQLGLRSNPAAAHEVLARAALGRDDLKTAETQLGQISGDSVAEANRFVLQAELEIRRERFEAALAALDAGERFAKQKGLEPPRSLAFLRGDALARLGRHAAAAQAFEQEIAAHPTNSAAYARLAIVYGLLHRTYGDVDRLLARMYAANPRPATAQIAAQTLESMGDKRGARSWAVRAQETTGR